eukprot:Sspe_Gene.88030::Locus_60165_Transcript_1_1_Confidence_1.000_Length_405::g.88030::m.88030
MEVDDEAAPRRPQKRGLTEVSVNVPIPVKRGRRKLIVKLDDDDDDDDEAPLPDRKKRKESTGGPTGVAAAGVSSSSYSASYSHKGATQAGHQHGGGSLDLQALLLS